MVGATSTYYFFPHYEVSGDGTTTTITKYYFFAGQRIAMRVGNTLYHLYGDRVPPGRGSTSLATDSSGGVGNPVRDQGYYPYGRYRRGGTLPTDHKFTGQKLDGSGLYYYGARYYDPQIGLFLSADTLVPDPGVVFDYNRYMYVRGNPMRLVDPTGHCSSMASTDENPTMMQMDCGPAGSSQSAGLAEQLMQELFELYQNHVAPDFYAKGRVGNVSVGQASIEVVFDASTNELALFYVYGLGTEVFSASAGAYNSYGWKGDKRASSIAEAYSGPSMGLAFEIMDTPVGVSVSGAVGGTEEDGIFFPDFAGVKTVSAGASAGADVITPLGGPTVSYLVYTPVVEPLAFQSDHQFVSFVQFVPGLTTGERIEITWLILTTQHVQPNR